MKFLVFIFSAVATATLSNFAMATESVPVHRVRSAPILAYTPQRGPAAIETAMGPTSAPQKPGGVGQDPQQQTPKLHKKAKHKYTVS